MKKLFFLIFMVHFSCEQKKLGGEVVDVEIDIIVENNNGENLLEESTTNFINADSIKLIYQINGSNFEVYNSNLSCIVSDDGEKRLRIFPNDTDSEENPITYLKWNSGDTDTIQCHFDRKNDGGFIFCDTVWFKGIQMFPDSAIPELGRAFKIIK